MTSSVNQNSKASYRDTDKVTSRIAEIGKFGPLASGIPGADAIEAYQRDDVVCLRNAFNDEWVEKDRRAVVAA